MAKQTPGKPPAETAPEKTLTIHDEIGELFKKHNITNGIAIFDLPQDPTKDGPPQAGVFFNGHFYEAAKLISRTFRQFRDRISEDLG